MEIREIRKILIDYFGTALPLNHCAIIDLSSIEQMSDDEVVKRALEYGLICLDNLPREQV